MSDYLTPFGSTGTGDGVNAEPRKAIKLIHDALLRAAREQLDVFMICSTLKESLRTDLYANVTGHSFAHSVEEVLRAGNDVSILVWSDQPIDYDVPEFQQLAANADEYAGKLSIRASGTTEGRDHVAHFLVAKRRDDARWIIRVETPHEKLDDTIVREETFRIPAAVVFTSEKAEKHGGKLMKIFHRLFNAITVPRLTSAADCVVGAEG